MFFTDRYWHFRSQHGLWRLHWEDLRGHQILREKARHFYCPRWEPRSPRRNRAPFITLFLVIFVSINYFIFPALSLWGRLILLWWRANCSGCCSLQFFPLTFLLLTQSPWYCRTRSSRTALRINWSSSLVPSLWSSSMLRKRKRRSSSSSGNSSTSNRAFLGPTSARIKYLLFEYHSLLLSSIVFDNYVGMWLGWVRYGCQSVPLLLYWKNCIHLSRCGFLVAASKAISGRCYF